MTELTLTDPGGLPDVASLAAGLGAALHSAGLPVGPDRCERLARAVTVMGARSIAELHACALATMVSDPAQMRTFEQVFAALFGTPSPLRDIPSPPGSAAQRPDQDGSPPGGTQTQSDQGSRPAGTHVFDTGADAPQRRRAADRGAGRAPGGLGRRTAARA